MRHFSFLLLLFLCVVPLLGRAGVVRGRITDPKNEPLAFANVAVRGETTSTASNEQGQYQLRLPAGTYQLVFQYVGYKPRLEQIRVAGGDTATVLNVTLTPEPYTLGNVTVRASDRDPAYAIVQHAIDWRRYHRAEVAAFTARTYIKAVVRLTDVPNKIFGLVKVDPGVKKGIVYLSESVSDLSFRQPNVVQERMISSRVSGNSRGFSVNRVSGQFNFYENMIKSGFSERGFVSPIAQNALLFYKYELVGTSQLNGHTLNKIRVSPRRRIDPAFSGFIYVLEDGTWRLHSVDLSLNSDAGIEYADKVQIEQLFGPAPGASHAWVLQSQKVYLSGSGLGFKGNASVNAVLSNYRVKPTYPAPPPALVAAQQAAPAPTDAGRRETVADAKQQRPQLRTLSRATRRQARQAAAATPDTAAFRPLAKGEIMAVEKGANERDSTYWNELRPIPLTDEERRDYQVKDSAEAITKSKPYQDSLDRKRNQVDPQKLLLLGYQYTNSFKKRTVSVEPVTNALQYNTVEGVVVNVEATYIQRYEDRRSYSLRPVLRYGFSNRLFSPSLSGGYTFRPQSFSRVGFAVGRTIENFDPRSQLTPFINSYYTLFTNRNYAKLYRRDALELNYRTEVANGLSLRLAAAYADRRELQNTTIKVVRDIAGRAFTSNQPVSEELPGGTGFGRSQALTLDALLTWQPGQQFITRPDGKFNLGNSKYPQFTLGVRQALRGVLGSDVRFTRLELGTSKNLGFGLFGESNFNVRAGTTLGASGLTFVDYRHFAGNLTSLAANFEQFQLLDYYRFSTRRSYLEAHYNHHFNGFFFNKIPLLRRLKWQEVASLNYLRTQAAGHYLELGVGVEHIFKINRIDFYTAFQSGQRLSSGFRYGIGF
ncbi:DUF5686 and carboxypeptidase regulatory-like domain-containing protein [Hymenobacter weizhouensis]|uniref:DUF5686 and carboxypeptidase regulatory-like domain-containing protein n=1 Tax=Hymenobacter sp. YIM 151500-1 TaxID=2987689 RepID=UPI002226D4ED|nr:DUF5686 and carboxypeptidase regulatory-like domain-containing protein [Hymenobacter sp. YIM 151500-1]UYZ61880.1 DUF5686 and carboxypeptidase regulatory-like domain-containing protein [Hymenobacter sp. YIM 151500-1]